MYCATKIAKLRSFVLIGIILIVALISSASEVVVPKPVNAILESATFRGTVLQRFDGIAGPIYSIRVEQIIYSDWRRCELSIGSTISGDQRLDSVTDIAKIGDRVEVKAYCLGDRIAIYSLRIIGGGDTPTRYTLRVTVSGCGDTYPR